MRKILWNRNSNISINRFFSNIKKRKQFKIENIIFSFIVISLLLILIGYYIKSNNILYISTHASGTTYKPTTIKGLLQLDNCRTIQSEDEHILDKGGHVYAMDIACIKGKSFNIYSPLWKDKYIVDFIGKDKRLGNYIILKHGEYKLVFGHTKSKLNIGDRIKSGLLIGDIDKSGLSQNYHLHFELWKNDYNISYTNMLGNNIIYNNEYTYNIRKQRGWYVGLNDAMKFISDLEGFRSCPYWDNTRYSIGYGTISKKGAKCITKEQAILLKKGVVEDILKYIYKNNILKYHNQRIALTSMLYNRGTKSRISKFTISKTELGSRKYVEEFIKNNTNDKYLKGIIKRHNLELDLYFNKM